jgi:hypothetical protein
MEAVFCSATLGCLRTAWCYNTVTDVRTWKNSNPSCLCSYAYSSRIMGNLNPAPSPPQARCYTSGMYLSTRNNPLSYLSFLSLYFLGYFRSYHIGVRSRDSPVGTVTVHEPDSRGSTPDRGKSFLSPDRRD